MRMTEGLPCMQRTEFEILLLFKLNFLLFQNKMIHVETSNVVLGHDVWFPLMAAMPAVSVRINAPAMEITLPLVLYVEAMGSTIETNANYKKQLALLIQTSQSSFWESAVRVIYIAYLLLIS